MIVDDSSVMRKMLKEFCSKFCDVIEEYSNGLDAVNNYTNSEPDYVLMDIKMPILNGLEAMKRIIHEHPKARIIIITQLKDSDLAGEALTHGAFHFLMKENLFELEKILNLNCQRS